jgi:hypothetical protein
MAPVDPSCLVGQWMHSHEEDGGGDSVYRPSSHAFPPSRGRQGFELKSDGSCVYQGIAAGDGAAGEDCRWILAGGDRLLLRPVRSQGRVYALEVRSCAPDRLVLRQLPGESR